MFGGWCGWNTRCHKRAVVSGEKRELGWKVVSATQELVGEGEEGWTAAPSSPCPLHAWGLPPCVQLAHPLPWQWFCSSVSSHHH